MGHLWQFSELVGPLRPVENLISIFWRHLAIGGPNDVPRFKIIGSSIRQFLSGPNPILGLGARSPRAQRSILPYKLVVVADLRCPLIMFNWRPPEAAARGACPRLRRGHGAILVQHHRQSWLLVFLLHAQAYLQLHTHLDCIRLLYCIRFFDCIRHIYCIRFFIAYATVSHTLYFYCLCFPLLHTLFKLNCYLHCMKLHIASVSFLDFAL